MILFQVAKSLERRWHQIWLRSLEWQCLLEQWLQHPLHAVPTSPQVAGIIADTDEEEPVNKVRRMADNNGYEGIPRLVDLFASPVFSPAATLLR